MIQNELGEEIRSSKSEIRRARSTAEGGGRESGRRAEYEYEHEYEYEQDSSWRRSLVTLVGRRAGIRAEDGGRRAEDGNQTEQSTSRTRVERRSLVTLVGWRNAVAGTQSGRILPSFGKWESRLCRSFLMGAMCAPAASCANY